jgi:hypothetical protein
MAKNTNPESLVPSPEPRGFVKRRDMLRAITAVPAAALIPLSTIRAAEGMVMPTPSPRPSPAAAQAVSTYKRQALNDHEWKTIQVLSDLIIPADDRSGSATQAGVPEFMDDWLAFKGGKLLAEIRGGLTWLDMECNRLFRHDFLDCSAAQQKEVLDRIAYPRTAAPEDANAVAFFNELRSLVVSGFFSSKMGIQDLPYLGNTMVADWQGCPPEVLAKLGLKPDGSKS